MKIARAQQLPLRIAVLTNTVPSYRLPVFNGLTANGDVELKVFVSLPRETAHPQARATLALQHSWGLNLRRRTRHRQAATENVEWLHIPVMLLPDLLRFQPDVIISGEFGLRSCAAWLVARLGRIPLILWSEEIREHAAGVSGLQRRLRQFLIPRADGFLAWGRPAQEYLRTWRVSEEKITYCAQAVDNAFWHALSRSQDRDALRRELEVRGRVFLAVGRFMRRKGFDKLLLAWHAMPASLREQNTLILVGDGPEDLALRELAQTKKLANVMFTGARAPEDLARYYAAADVFVFPSLLDVWGLVVNEAMAFGLPVLASRHAGASQELVQEGLGALFDPNDADEFTRLLQDWCGRVLPNDRARIRRIAAQLNFDVSVSAIRTLCARLSGRLLP